MKTTMEYFDLSIAELLDDIDARGYTREECKLFEIGKVHFCDDAEEFEEENKDIVDWYKNTQGLDFATALTTVNNRVAMIFN